MKHKISQTCFQIDKARNSPIRNRRIGCGKAIIDAFNLYSNQSDLYTATLGVYAPQTHLQSLSRLELLGKTLLGRGRRAGYCDDPSTTSAQPDLAILKLMCNTLCINGDNAK